MIVIVEADGDAVALATEKPLESGRTFTRLPVGGTCTRVATSGWLEDMIAEPWLKPDKPRPPI